MNDAGARNSYGISRSDHDFTDLIRIAAASVIDLLRFGASIYDPSNRNMVAGGDRFAANHSEYVRQAMGCEKLDAAGGLHLPQYRHIVSGILRYVDIAR